MFAYGRKDNQVFAIGDWKGKQLIVHMIDDKFRATYTAENDQEVRNVLKVWKCEEVMDDLQLESGDVVDLIPAWIRSDYR